MQFQLNSMQALIAKENDAKKSSLVSQLFICTFLGSMKTGPKENWSYVKMHLENSSCGKTYLENSSENFLTDFFGRTMISADAS